MSADTPKRYFWNLKKTYSANDIEVDSSNTNRRTASRGAVAEVLFPPENDYPPSGLDLCEKEEGLIASQKWPKHKR